MADANLNARGGPSLKNIAAFHELMRREGWAVPAISSKFVNLETLTLMYTGKIYNLRQDDVCYRECVKPPSKLAMVQKFEQLLLSTNSGKKSGIIASKANYPDKEWLVKAVATLSNGEDEIFGIDYLPSKAIDAEIQR